MYALQDPKQPCSNRGRQIFTKRHRETITSISSGQSRQGLHSLFLLSPDCHTMESTPQSDMPGNLALNFQNQCCEGRALQAQLIPKISSISLPALFAFLSVFFLLSFFISTDLPHILHSSRFPFSRLTVVLLLKCNTPIFIFIFSSYVYVVIISKCDVLPMHRKRP